MFGTAILSRPRHQFEPFQEILRRDHRRSDSGQSVIGQIPSALAMDLRRHKGDQRQHMKESHDADLPD
jgi:hypothetical protein